LTASAGSAKTFTVIAAARAYAGEQILRRFNLSKHTDVALLFGSTVLTTQADRPGQATLAFKKGVFTELWESGTCGGGGEGVEAGGWGCCDGVVVG
jgi:hypothetical protein